MKLKGIKLEGTYKVVCYATNLVVYDEKGNQIYFEKGNGFWVRWEYNEKGNVIYSENRNGYWCKCEYNEKGKRIYFEDSEDEIVDERVRKLTIEQIENLLGYKIKIEGK